MNIREFINETSIYAQCESEIRDWVESSYPGLSIEFTGMSPEIVQVDAAKKFTKSRVRKITEVVNIKIGDVLEAHAEEIYVAERLERIYKNHPEFNLRVGSLEEIKRNETFCAYLKELIF